jgi:hypothetical protein
MTSAAVLHFAGRAYNSRMDITLPELEQAINYWRSLRPSRGEERALSPEVDALATVYAMMIFKQAKTIPMEAIDHTSQQLLESWRRRDN